MEKRCQSLKTLYYFIAFFEQWSNRGSCYGLHIWNKPLTFIMSFIVQAKLEVKCAQKLDITFSTTNAVLDSEHLTSIFLNSV